MATKQKAAPGPKVLSLRDSVRGAVVQLLDDEGMACLKTQEGLVTLINALAHYTEEGRALFPEVFILDSLETALAMMPGSEHVSIGSGDKTPDTMARALKKCAPLARLGWAVYIVRQPECFSYGVLRSGATILSLGLADILVNKGDPQVPVIMLHQIGPNVIEVRGVSQSSLLVHFGAGRETDASPAPTIDRFVGTIVDEMPAAIQEQALMFYRGIVTDVLHSGHGALAAVIGKKRKALPKQFSDAIILTPPISVCDKISDLLAKAESQRNMQLQACSSLITGMLLSDGITVFGSDGTVRAYNVFVKHPKTKSAEASAGGARHRTFQVLSNMVGKELRSAYMQSQDGRVDFSKGVQDG